MPTTLIDRTLLTDEQLLDALLVLQIGCGKGKAVIKKKNRVQICTLMRALDVEATLRGLPHTSRPSSQADLIA